MSKQKNPDSEVLGTVVGLEKLRNSASANPRWRIKLDSGATYSTGTDYQVGYAISGSLLGKRVALNLRGGWGNKVQSIRNLDTGEVLA